ncbi:MAG: metal-dependent transcriptional regulator [Syntrophomonadaceae bacterium]|nr:metal-dependent transcriptional regulator [Syntrophomonadaceae bacterium]
MKGLSISMKRYIKAIYELAGNGMGVRISDIAAKVGVTRASACLAMKTLQKKELVYRDADSLVFLTKEGEYQAILALDKVAIIRNFLHDMLHIKYEIAHTEACAIESVISAETFCSLCRFTRRKCIGGCYVKTVSPPREG